MSSTLYAGVARCEITLHTPERAVRDPLFAKVLVLKDDETTVVLVTMDVVAIGGICEVSDGFLPALRERVERGLGIPGEALVVNASHTHPPEPILCSEAELLDRVAMAVGEAVAALVPVRVGAGRVMEAGISMNRNLRLRNGRQWTIRHTNPSPPEEEIEALGPVDPEVGILRIDRLDGTPFAVLYHFACHLLFGDPEGSITGNFPNIASRYIESVVGGGVTAFFLQGSAGDVIDTGFKDLYRVRDIEPFGQRLALSVLKTLPEIATVPSARLKLISSVVELPRRTDFADRIVALEEEQRELLATLRGTTLSFQSFLPLYLQHRLNPEAPFADAYTYLHARKIGDPLPASMKRVNEALIEKYCQNIRVMERLAHLQDDLATVRRHEVINKEAGGDPAPAEVLGLRVGEFVLLTAPIELLTEINLNLKRVSPHRYTYISGFTNGYMHYGPPAREYGNGSYEVTECFLAKEWQAIFERKAEEILREI